MKDDDTQLAKFDFESDAKEVQNQRDPHPDIDKLSKAKNKGKKILKEATEKRFAM